MNYRHIYHAGNFADVLKHVVLTLVIEHLKAKEAPFRVIDTHAGPGIYDLGSENAQKTGEWLGGIGRLLGPASPPIPPPMAALLAPYLGAVGAFNQPGLLTRYPGSPRIARALMRPQDRLVVNELHPEDCAELRRVFGRDPQAKVMDLDGWVALKALLPPIERRGVILIDPPYEAGGELMRMAAALEEAVTRFATGIYILWYPIKDRSALRIFNRRLSDSGLPKLLQVELELADTEGADRLSGSGLIIHNPPYQLEENLARLLPWLAQRLMIDRKGRWEVNRLGAASRNSII
jgi:23S rRNA (adenine2030-N6)-methyltransferase